MTGDWFEVVEAVSAGLLAVLPLAWLWGRLDRQSPRAALVRRIGSRPGARYVFAAVLAASLFAIAAEDVLDADPRETLVRLDGLVRDAIGAAASRPAVRRVASVVSDLTGAGLVGALVTGAVGLVVVRRRQDAVVIAAGTLSAWLGSALLKVMFAVPRPHSAKALHAVSGYGFPSAHAFLAVVGCGLLAWVMGREAPPAVRRVLYAAAAFVAGLTGAARVVLDAHRVSDVIAGFAMGLIWLNLVLLIVSTSRTPDATSCA